jgi:hypothetical protein
MGSPADIEQWRKAQRAALPAKRLEITKAECRGGECIDHAVADRGLPDPAMDDGQLLLAIARRIRSRCFYWNCLSPKGGGVSTMASCVPYRTYCN